MDTLSFRIFSDSVDRFACDPADCSTAEQNARLAVLCNDLLSYVYEHTVKPCDLDPLAVVGVHRDSGRDHLHLHVQVVCWKEYKNESRRRRDWFNKNGLDLPPGQDVTMTSEMAVTDEEKQKDHLAYVLKEGNHFPLVDPPHTRVPSPSELEELLARGKGIYDAAQRAVKQREVRSEKAKSIINQLMEIDVPAHLEYPEWKQILLSEYYKRFESPLEYPNVNDVKNAVQKIAMFRKVVPISYFI